jgi:hypothetical protein
MSTIVQRSLRSFSWTAGAQIIVVGVGFARSVLLARLLDVETFGIVPDLAFRRHCNSGAILTSLQASGIVYSPVFAGIFGALRLTIEYNNMREEYLRS